MTSLIIQKAAILHAIDAAFDDDDLDRVDALDDTMRILDAVTELNALFAEKETT